MGEKDEKEPLFLARFQHARTSAALWPSNSLVNLFAPLDSHFLSLSSSHCTKWVKNTGNCRMYPSRLVTKLMVFGRSGCKRCELILLAAGILDHQEGLLCSGRLPSRDLWVTLGQQGGEKKNMDTLVLAPL